ncbi:MAG: riboflavin kinase [Candidatus Methanomethylicota archaeon]|uniref:Riboflavin kinase n=1 Tax=Thermoproteota archaeon TaxID=2056631 RepID=A0A497F1N5_9CREN|nr:MAG: riboflavin kinase [Candidatus Verstraetearchaeota archaeon]
MFDVKERHLMTLYKLALLGGCWKPIFIATKDLGKVMGISQQSASRRLKELEEMKLIMREVSRRGQFVKITDKGLKVLREVYTNLKRVFSEIPKSFTIRGYVFSGFGEGAYYMSIPYYYEQFVKKLGFKPYHGTLNLKLKGIHDLEVKKLLSSLPGIEIKGFSNGRRTYGGAKCFKAKIGGVDGAVVLIERTHYGEDVMEVISPKKLRDELNLNDGDEVVVEVFVGP